MSLEEIKAEIRRIRITEMNIRIVVFIFYVIFMYLFLSLFKKGVIDTYYLLRFILLIKYIIVLVIAVLIAVFIGLFYLHPSAVDFGFMIAIKTVSTIIPLSSRDINNILNFNTYIVSELMYLKYEIVTLAFVLTLLLGLGAILSGKYSYILDIIILLILILPFSYAFGLLDIKIPELHSISDIYYALNSRFILFLVFTFIFIEISRATGYAPNLLHPLKERLYRVQQMFHTLASGRVHERARPHIDTIEHLSRISKIFLKDAYISYAFTDRSSLMYISSKLYALIREESKKDPNLLRKISGITTLPSLGRIFLDFIKSLILKVLLAVLLATVAFSIPIFYQNLGIVEASGLEFAVMMSLLLALFLLVVLERILRS